MCSSCRCVAAATRGISTRANRSPRASRSPPISIRCARSWPGRTRSASPCTRSSRSGPIWNQATGPASPAHVFAQHGFTPSGPVAGRENWLTRARPGDATPTTALGGYRFGLDFWLDPGHPDAAAYTVDVIAHLVAAYEIDGLHLDALRYPDAIAAPGSTADAEPSVGYNDVSLERFRRRYDLAADALPAPTDGAWSDWRRTQVTALLGRITLASLAIRPSLVVSIGVAATGDAPVAATPGGEDADAAAWSASEPFRRAFQDWYRWSEDGLVDALVPLIYRTEHTTAGADAFGAWVRWARAHAGGRQLVVAVGAYLNAIEGTLREVRRATAPPTTAGDPPPADGVVLFSMGAHNAPVAGNPLAVSGPRDTPYRSFDDLASGLVIGRTTTGQALEIGGLAAVFATPTTLPIPAWKLTPATGHLRGTITIAGRDGTTAADGAGVALEWVTDNRRTPGGAVPPAPTIPAVAPADGGGVYGRLDLAPGRYRILVSPVGDGVYRSACTVTIAAGLVATEDLTVDPAKPAVATCVTPSRRSQRAVGFGGGPQPGGAAHAARIAVRGGTSRVSTRSPKTTPASSAGTSVVEARQVRQAAAEDDDVRDRGR